MSAVLKQKNLSSDLTIQNINSGKIKLTLVNNNRSFKFVDLFAGIGGLKLPFEKLGGKCVITSEINESAIKTYKINSQNLKNHTYFGDVTKIKNDDIPNYDLLLAGFPCQSYSIAGLRLGLDDPRGKLFLEIIRFLEVKKPKAFVLENVKGLVSHDDGKTFKYIINELEKQGYTVYSKVMNSMKYGNIPQNRERVYIVGFLNTISSINFNFPKELKLTKTISDCLENFKVDDKYYYDNRFACFNTIKNTNFEENTVYQWRRKYLRANKNNVCPTLTANMGTGGHNVPLIKDHWGIRKLTPRECARLQGFPDSFILPDIADSKLYQQFGNSVTVTVIERIAQEIMKVIS